MFRSLAVVLLITAAGARIAAADCMSLPLAPAVLTPSHTAVGATGGAVVAWVRASRDGSTPRKDWMFHSGAKVGAPKIVAIAPGLDLYVPPFKAARLTLADGGPAVELSTVEVGGVALAAPTVHAIRFTAGHGRHASSSVIAELTGDPPAGAVALVVFDGHDVARSFGSVGGNAKFVTVYQGGGCLQTPQHTVPSVPTESVRVAWVDAAGTLSPKSEPIKVTGDSAAPQPGDY